MMGARLTCDSSTILVGGDAATSYTCNLGDRARYRPPIDDRARYWANFFWGGWGGGKMNIENFQRKKKE